MVSFKVKVYQRDSHVHFDLYSNEFGPEYSHGLASTRGPICLRAEEFEAFIERLGAIVEESSWDERGEP